MSCIKDNTCWRSADYVEEITGNRPSEDVTLEEWENTKNPDYLDGDGECSEYYSSDYWNYPLTEIDEIIEGKHEVVLVRFPNCYGGYDYRFCEI